MITIIVPIHNSELYLDKCLNSIYKQTYKDIEVLCIDSSTDSSTDIINKYVSKYPRFKLIKDGNSSYGYKINLGITLAKGSYIGIVEADDYISSKMYEDAYNAIKEYRCDFVKMNYESFHEDHSYLTPCGFDKNLYKDIFNTKDKPNAIYDSNIAIWSGLYRRKFLIDNNIKLNESKGACFQDTGFFIQTLIYAKRVKYLKGKYYKYRRNSIDSSSLSNKNPYSIINEFDYIFNTIDMNNITSKQYEAIIARKIIAYSWNYIRLEKNLAIKFKKKINNYLKKIYSDGTYENLPLRVKKYLDDSKLFY